MVLSNFVIKKKITRTQGLLTFKSTLLLLVVKGASLGQMLAPDWSRANG